MDELERFRSDVAKFSGHYQEFLVIVKSGGGRLMWKSSDTTWAIGALNRYLSCIDECDREDERSAMNDHG